MRISDWSSDVCSSDLKASTLTEAQAEEQLLAFLAQHVPSGKSPMCGNTIGQDRRFMVKYMPRLEAFFHYRNLDVSTLKELSLRWKPEVYRSFVKKSRHEALADIRSEEHTSELQSLMRISYAVFGL